MRRTIFLLIFLLGPAVACKSDRCPPGTERYGDTCRAIPQDLGPVSDILLPDLPVADPSGETREEGPLDVRDDEQTTDDHPGDPGPDTAQMDVFPGGVVGKSCQKSSDCRNDQWTGSCLDWKKGYCAVKGCGEGGVTCPEGALCMGVSLDQPTCVKACEGDGDCRIDDGYACKVLPDLQGGVQRICHEVTLPGLPGEGCASASECQGTQDCLAQFTGGYCAQVTCGPDLPCPEGARCVRLSGKPICLRSCETSDDCRVPGDLPRSCLMLRDAVTGDRVGACGSAVTGSPIGAQCLNDTECASQFCQVTVLGTCSSTGRPCVEPRDCNPAEYCRTSPDVAAGFCTASCSNSQPCQGQALCLETLGSLNAVQGWCMPGCSDTPCRTEAAMECRYGDPLIVPGKYACVRLRAGDPGSPCRENGDCRLGRCLKTPDDTAGYCTVGCATLQNARCPFPTTCALHQGESLCLHRCQKNGDCPAGTHCDPDAQPLPVCIL